MKTISPSVKLLYYFHLDGDSLLPRMLKDREVFNIYMNIPIISKAGYAEQKTIYKSLIKDMKKNTK